MVTRKYLYLIIIIALILSLPGLAPRFQAERENKTVDFIYDSEGYQDLKEEIEISLKDLNEWGVTGLAVYEDTLDDLPDQDLARYLSGAQLESTALTAGTLDQRLAELDFDHNSAFFFLTSREAEERIKNSLAFWPEDVEYQLLDLDDRGKVLYFPEWDSDYNKLSLGFDEQLIAEAQNAGLKLTLRMENRETFPWQEVEEYNPEYIIFAGPEVLGYPDRIEEIAELMQRDGIKYGMIEPFIGYQRGSRELASYLDNQSLRLHSIQDEEMENNNREWVESRYLRALKERNVRLLFLKPFLEVDEGVESTLYDYNREYIQQLTQEAETRGYQLGEAAPFPPFSNHPFFLLTSLLGIGAAVIVFLSSIIVDKYSKLFIKYSPLLLSISILIGILFYIFGLETLLRQILALGAAVIFPVVAINKGLKGFSASEDNITNTIGDFIKVSLISLVGAIFLAVSLGEASFLLKIDQFRGVKVAFALPLLLITIYYLQLCYKSKGKISLYQVVKEFLEVKVKIKHILLGVILLIGGVFYLGRTGNFPWLPVPAWELTLRDILERVFLIRPRFKEFLFGHPFLLLILAYRQRLTTSLLYYPLVLLAAIGQITVLNSFSHIHTPLTVTLSRVGVGYLLGFILGLILYYLCFFGEGLWRRFLVEEREFNE